MNDVREKEGKNLLNIEYKKANERWCALIISLHETFIEYLRRLCGRELREGKRLGRRKKVVNCQSFVRTAPKVLIL
jgi:hypothetical protein